MDIMWIEGVSIIHVIDTHTNFQNATILREGSFSESCSAFVECWASVYTGYSAVVGVNQESGSLAKVSRV